LRAIALLEGTAQPEHNLSDILQEALRTAELPAVEGRVRDIDPDMETAPYITPASTELETATSHEFASAVSEDTQFETPRAIFSAWTAKQACLEPGVFVVRNPDMWTKVWWIDYVNSCIGSEEFIATAIYAADRDNRPLSAEEIELHKQDVSASQLKELESWVKHRTGTAIPIAQYCKETGLQPLPTRWVLNWKVKDNLRIVKSRLVVKGFAERNQASLHTASPTASRLAHRLVCLIAACQRWHIYSLDVSTAFLQGWSFDQMSDEGYERQPCSLKLSPEIWQLQSRASCSQKLAPSASTSALPSIRAASDCSYPQPASQSSRLTFCPHAESVTSASSL
jgi:hypothetical protein